MTSRSAGSQPLDSDSTVDIGCSPVNNNYNNNDNDNNDRRHFGSSPTQFASDATTTDGWCTPRKSPSESPRKSSADCRPHGASGGQLAAVHPAAAPSLVVLSAPQSSPRLLRPRRSELTDNTSSSVTGRRRLPESDAPRRALDGSAAGPRRIPPGPEAADDDVRSCAGAADRSSSSSSTNVPPRRDVSNQVGTDRETFDDYEADVDSDSDVVIGDVIGPCVGRTVRRRRMRSPSVVVIVSSSSSSDSDQSEPLLSRSRDRRSKDGVGGGGPEVATLISSGGGGESDDGLRRPGCAETDYRRHLISGVERSPVLFSESST